MFFLLLGNHSAIYSLRSEVRDETSATISMKAGSYFTAGDPNDPDIFMGALNSKIHLEKVEKYGHLAKEEGGTIHCGFGVTKIDVHKDLQNGYYFPPTIVTGLTNKSR